MATSRPPALDNKDLATANVASYVMGTKASGSRPKGASTQKSTPANQRQKTTAADYSGGSRRNRTPGKSADARERIMGLEKENNGLKEKENVLRSEITKMQTKLHRIEGLLRSRSHAGTAESRFGGGGAGTDLAYDLQQEFDELKSRCSQTKERVRKLNVIQRGLAARPATAARPNKYAHVQGKLEVTHTKATQDCQRMAEDLRQQLVANQREILKLQQEFNAINERHGGQMGSISVEKLRAEVQAMFQATRDTTIEIEKLEGNFVSNENIFKQTKQYTTDVQAQIRTASAANEGLKHENFKLQLQTQEVAHINEEIREITIEKEGIERSLRQIATEPFMRKEGQSVASRIADLELKLKERTAVATARKEEETKLAAQNKQKKTALQKLQGERDYLSGEHSKATADFRTTHQNRSINEQDAAKGLLETDSKLYSRTLTDLAMGGSERPIWANLPFLDRYGPDTQSQDPKEHLQKEIEALRQEKQEFAAELEKASRLLTLQKDIEKENLVYFDQEKQRLALVERSAAAKLEELAIRADDKSKSIMELQRKVESNKYAAATGASQVARADEDALSEFSVLSNESEIKNDENILDFKILDAEFYSESFVQIPALGSYQAGEHPQKGFITLVTCDFYNHNTETSQPADGMHPNYQTQLSFKNKVDDFYITFLQKQCLKLDVYLSKNNQSVHMGRCDVMLKELVEREVASQNVSYKTPLIERWARIFPQGMTEGKPVGVVKYKMRLRRPITEQMRFYRDKNEVANMSRLAEMQVQGLNLNKKLVTIQVVAAHSLKLRYADHAEVAPFFYYQFFTFEERYSSNGAGSSPQFNDSFSYEVAFDSKAMDYFTKEALEVILFDDNAPIAGSGPDNAAGPLDDMIGVCKVPLNSLIAGCSTHDRYPVKRSDSTETVGYLEVKVTVADLAGNTSMAGGGGPSSGLDLHYSQEWADEVISAIASRLARHNCSIELLFGIFSNSMSTTTKEDFKYCLLQRLQLNEEIADRELDLLLASNEFFANKTYIDRNDFIAVFKEPIEQARMRKKTQVRQGAGAGAGAGAGVQQFEGGEASHRAGALRSQPSMQQSLVQQYNESEVLQCLAESIAGGNYNKIVHGVGSRVRGAVITCEDLVAVLRTQGMVPEIDGLKVARMIEVDGNIAQGRVDTLMKRALIFARDHSAALRKFMEAFSRQGRTLVRRFEAQDVNKDGLLSCDGFQAAFLVPEIGLPADELREVFHLVANYQDQLSYREWLSDHFPLLQDQVSGSIGGAHTASRDLLRADSVLTGRDTLNDRTLGGGIDISQSLGGAGIELPQSSAHSDQHLVSSAKQKVENYIRAQDINLGVMFAVLDTDSSKRITRVEFRQKVKALHVRLDDDEITALFAQVDGNRDGTIGYDELVEQFAAINTSQLIRKMQRIIAGSKVAPEYFFKKYAKGDASNQRMGSEDFSRLIRELYEKATRPEISHVFAHFDRGRKGFLTQEDFLKAFTAEVREDVQMSSVGHYTATIEDIIKPLATKIAKLGRSPVEIFDGYDRNRNFRLSPEELRQGLQRQGITLDGDEVQVVREYFQARFSSPEITRQQFAELLSANFSRKCDAGEARKALSDLKGKFDSMKHLGKTAKQLLSEFNPEKTELISQRAFKQALHSLRSLSYYAIDNLTKHLDHNNEGFISIGDFDASVARAAAPAGQTTRTLGSTGRSTNKWAKQ